MVTPWISTSSDMPWDASPAQWLRNPVRSLAADGGNQGGLRSAPARRADSLSSPRNVGPSSKAVQPGFPIDGPAPLPAGTRGIVAAKAIRFAPQIHRPLLDAAFGTGDFSNAKLRDFCGRISRLSARNEAGVTTGDVWFVEFIECKSRQPALAAILGQSGNLSPWEANARTATRGGSFRSQNHAPVSGVHSSSRSEPPFSYADLAPGTAIEWLLHDLVISLSVSVRGRGHGWSKIALCVHPSASMFSIEPNDGSPLSAGCRAPPPFRTLSKPSRLFVDQDLPPWRRVHARSGK